MFTADPRFLSKNPLFQKIKARSTFMRFASPPPIVEAEFGSDWIQEVETRIDGVIARWYFFPDIAPSLTVLRNVEGYDRLKRKLKPRDDDFFTLASQLEISAWLCRCLPRGSAALEDCFETSRGKHPDLRLQVNAEPYFVDTTKVVEYNGQLAVWNLQFGFSMLADYMMKTTGTPLSISLQFHRSPDEIEINEILQIANELVKRGMLDQEFGTENFTITLNTFGNGVTVSELPRPWVDKLKDRFLDKCAQFDPGQKNVVVIDVTSMLGTFKTYCEAMTKVYNTVSTDLISCVILFEKTYVLEADEIRSRTGFMMVPNPLARDGHEVKTSLYKLLVNVSI
jgi:hypothetical protein